MVPARTSLCRSAGTPSCIGWVGCVAGLLCLALAGCGGSGPSSQTPTPLAGPGVPERLEPMGPGLRIAPADTLAGGGCHATLVDPRAGARLILVRSWVQHGDYEVTADLYGLRSGSLVRVECNTGRPLGAVRR